MENISFRTVTHQQKICHSPLSEAKFLLRQGNQDHALRCSPLVTVLCF